MKTIRWGQVTRSGLCDRLEDLLLMAAYARLKHASLLVDWPDFEAKDIDVAHRSQDILLENILKFMTFPKEVAFSKVGDGDETFGSYLGGAITPEKFHSDHLKEQCSLEHFDDVVQDVAWDFGFCDAINDFLKTLPPKFVTFHIRRGDKVRLAKEHDGTFILKDELVELNRLTFKAMDYFMEKDFKTFFICGDEDAEMFPFQTKAIVLGMNLIQIPTLAKWESTFYDLAVMTQSRFNICSQRYSSFSHFPSVIGGVDFDTVYDLQKEGLI